MNTKKLSAPIAFGLVLSSSLGSVAFAQDEDTITEVWDRAARRARHGQIEEAITLFREVAELAPGEPDVMYNLAALYAEERQFAECSLYYRLYLSLLEDPEADAEVADAMDRCDSRAAEFGGTLRLDVASIPEDANAQILLNGQLISPRFAQNMTLPAGSYNVVIDAEDLEDWSHGFQLAVGESVSVPVSVTARIYYGTMMLGVSEEGASILVDGSPIATTPLSEPYRLRTGRYLVAVEKEGFHRWNRYIEITRDGEYFHDLVLHDEAISIEELTRR